MLAWLRRRTSAWLAWLAWAGGLFGLYLLLVDTTTSVELAIGAAVAAIAATSAVAIRAQGLYRYRLAPELLLALARVPYTTVREFGVLTLVVLRRLARRPVADGSFRAIPFDAGGSDPESRARRAFVSVAGTIAPNTIVVGIDRERGLALLHELAPEHRSSERPL